MTIDKSTLALVLGEIRLLQNPYRNPEQPQLAVYAPGWDRAMSEVEVKIKELSK